MGTMCKNERDRAKVRGALLWAKLPADEAVALAGGPVQRPLDIRIKDNSWDFFSDPGREALDHLEEDPALRWRHWGPNCRTFSRARGRPITLKGKGKVRGPARVRSEDQPWGLDNISRQDQIKVRQDNKMAKRALSSLETTHRQGGYAGLEHPYDSLLWYTPEAERVRSLPGFMVSTWSQCCFGGRRTKWTSLLHNSRRVHQVMHNPTCNCTHQEPYRVHQTSGGLHFDTSDESEYPWRMCQAYASAIAADLKDLVVPPIGTAKMDLSHSLYNQIMGSTRGLQSEDLVCKLVMEVQKLLSTMKPGQEGEHLADLGRHVGLKGTDIRLVATKESKSGREVMTPYPAFQWFWRTMMAYRWATSQHINVLEMTAILAELRRRARSALCFKTRYVHVIDSMVCYWALEKGDLHRLG